MGNSRTSVFPITHAWEQQERNQTETDEDGKKRSVSNLSMERSKAGTNKRSADGLSHPNQNTIIIQNIVIFYKKWKKYTEIQLTKNKLDLNIRKNDKSSVYVQIIIFAK